MSNAPEADECAGHESVPSTERFGHLIERGDDADFPFCNGTPATLSVGQWTTVWTSVAVGFAALVVTWPTSGRRTCGCPPAPTSSTTG